MRRILLSLLLALATATAAPVLAASEHERVREAVERGEILPLSAVLPKVRAAVPGRVLDATARGGGDTWRYVVKMLTPDNRVVVVTADARTGQVLSVAGGDARRGIGRR